jgi:hypothetical protein
MVSRVGIGVFLAVIVQAAKQRHGRRCGLNGVFPYRSIGYDSAIQA